MDEIAILTAAMGAQAAQDLDSLQQVGFADAVRSNDEQAWLLQLHHKLVVVSKPLQLKRLEPDGSLCGVWVRYRDRVDLSGDLLLSLPSAPVGM